MNTKDKEIPYSTQSISNEDIEEVVKTLKSTFLTQGPLVPEFEKKFSNYSGAKYGVATNSATSALHVACMALDLSKGDWLWTSPNSFVASANCGIYCGANVDFVDIDPKTYNISIAALEKKLKQAEIEGKLPKIIIPVHYAGQSSEMQKIFYLSNKYRFKIIEDASHAAGAEYKGKKVGCCQYSHIAVFSFHPIKIITTMEGGMALTNDENLAEKLKRHRSHGITSEKRFMSPRNNAEIWNYQQITLGYNYRMTNIQASLLYGQLESLEEIKGKKHKIFNRYTQIFEDIKSISLQEVEPDTEHSEWIFGIRFNEFNLVQKEKMELNLFQSGIDTRKMFYPISSHKHISFMPCDENISTQLNHQCILIPSYPDLNNTQIEYITRSIKNHM
jgi:dTDP-4-amino-4,6-dideoxygalactose transaminase